MIEQELMEEEDKNDESDSDSDSSSDSDSISQSKASKSSNNSKSYLSTTGSNLTLFCGTKLYMAPELHLLGAGSHEADVWAMGVIIYILLVGHWPWRIHEISKMICAYISFPEDFDESAKEFIKGCLATDASKRIG